MIAKHGVPALVLLISTSALAVYGQSNASVVRSNTWEIGAFVGGTYGGTGVASSGSSNEGRVMGGGNVTYAITRIILPYAEFSYFPGIPRETTIPGTSGGPTPYSIALRDFHGGVHIRLPIFRESSFVPYAAFGVGALTSSSFGLPIKNKFGEQIDTLQIPSRTDFAVNGGGGVRYYIGQHFGLRVEAKVYKPTGDYSNTFGKVEGGFFFQLH